MGLFYGDEASDGLAKACEVALRVSHKYRLFIIQAMNDHSQPPQERRYT